MGMVRRWSHGSYDRWKASEPHLAVITAKTFRKPSSQIRQLFLFFCAVPPILGRFVAITGSGKIGSLRLRVRSLVSILWPWQSSCHSAMNGSMFTHYQIGTIGHCQPIGTTEYHLHEANNYEILGPQVVSIDSGLSLCAAARTLWLCWSAGDHSTLHRVGVSNDEPRRSTSC